MLQLVSCVGESNDIVCVTIHVYQKVYTDVKLENFNSRSNFSKALHLLFTKLILVWELATVRIFLYANLCTYTAYENVLIT